MADLSPLKLVYTHYQTGQTSTTLIRRRYLPGGTQVGVAGLTSRGPYQERPVPTFEVPPSDNRTPTDQGAEGGARRRVYSTHDFKTTNAPTDESCDVVFDLSGRAYLVAAVSDWNEAKGYEVTLESTQLRKGQRPFDA